jgi:hypothetical protein
MPCAATRSRKTRGQAGGDQHWLISKQSPASGPNRGSLFPPTACRHWRIVGSAGSFTSRHFQNTSELGSLGQMTKLRGDLLRGRQGAWCRRAMQATADGHRIAKRKKLELVPAHNE